MSGQRITRDAFDAVVQEKMKRYRIGMDQAIANTVREFQMEGEYNVRALLKKIKMFGTLLKIYSNTSTRYINGVHTKM